MTKPLRVAAAFMQALFDDNPLRRYVVVPNAEEQAYTIGTQIKMLDEALAGKGATAE